MLPIGYAWLEKEPGPKMILEALKLYGVREVAGDGDNAEILAWRNEIRAVSETKARGVADYVHDLQPWCGLFMAIVALRAGKEFPDRPLWALNWCGFGMKSPKAGLGDVFVFERHDAAGNFVGGHVGLYVGEDESAFHILGGNQKDAVNIARVERARLKAVRRPLYKIGQPPNVRQIILKPDGQLSMNEA